VDREEILSRIVEMSKGQTVEYQLVNFRGIPLLITKNKLEPLISRTWELDHDTELEKIAKEFGITLRKFR
jgi:hypothetical protein